MTTSMTMTDDDDTVLDRLRRACADQPDQTGRTDLTQLYALRDEALSRGLPLPSSCPMDPVGAS